MTHTHNAHTHTQSEGQSVSQSGSTATMWPSVSVRLITRQMAVGELSEQQDGAAADAAAADSGLECKHELTHRSSDFTR